MGLHLHFASILKGVDKKAKSNKETQFLKEINLAWNKKNHDSQIITTNRIIMINQNHGVDVVYYYFCYILSA